MIDATLSGTFRLGGDLPVHRLGFGAMRITGKGIWGPPADRTEALACFEGASNWAPRSSTLPSRTDRM